MNAGAPALVIPVFVCYSDMNTCSIKLGLIFKILKFTREREKGKERKHI